MMCTGCGTQLPKDGTAPTVAKQKQPVNCPACGVSDDYKPAVELRGSFNLLAFLAGGLLAVIFHNASRKKRVRCNKCGAFFSIQTRLSKLSLVFFWLLVLPAIAVILVVLFIFLRSFVS